ncbi:hypothetical protein DRQ36_08325 [bacterium]|nr:MAG: hypothetical protein DRQ36_08325 [bacterium]
MKPTAITFALLLALLLAASLSAQNPGCRAGFDGSYIKIFATGMMPVPYFYDSLSSWFSYFRVDSPTTEIHFDSVDVYFVPPRVGEPYSSADPYPDSLILEFRRFVYNGGILFMWGENCSGWTGSFGIIYDSLDGWFLGIEPAQTTAYDSIECIGSGGWYYFYYYFTDNPLIPPMTDPVYGSLGSSVYIYPPAITLATTSPIGFSWFCSDTTLDEIQPVVLGLSHYGKGTVIFHTDFTAWRHAWSGYPANNNLQLLRWLTTCSLFPHFTHFPTPGQVFICFDDTVFIQTDISNFGRIEPESLRIWWEGSVYDTSSPQLELIGDTTFVFSIPPHSYTDGDTILLCIETIVDTSGFWHYDSICWEYYVSIDEYPPELSAFQPAVGETVMVLDTISLIATDTSGIDTSSISFTFLDSTIVWGDSSIWINGDTIFFDPVSAGLDPGMVDTNIYICIHISDDNKDCMPTAIDTCWDFFLDADAIVETNLPDNFKTRVWPNPFNSSCRIVGPHGAKAKIYSISGKLIRTLELPAIWDGKDEKGLEMGSGVYFIEIRIETKNYIKVVLLK